MVIHSYLDESEVNKGSVLLKISYFFPSTLKLNSLPILYYWCLKDSLCEDDRTVLSSGVKRGCSLSHLSSSLILRVNDAKMGRSSRYKKSD